MRSYPFAAADPPIRRPSKPCGFPRCAQFQPCPLHGARRREVQRLYDGEHHRLRIACFKRDGWKCRHCGWEPDTIVEYGRFGIGEPPEAEILAELRRRFHAKEKHLQADHIVAVNIMPERARDLSNMQTLCDACHRRKSNEEAGEAY
jgi:hypothetical protein